MPQNSPNTLTFFQAVTKSPCCPTVSTIFMLHWAVKVPFSCYSNLLGFSSCCSFRTLVFALLAESEIKESTATSCKVQSSLLPHSDNSPRSFATIENAEALAEEPSIHRVSPASSLSYPPPQPFSPSAITGHFLLELGNLH